MIDKTVIIYSLLMIMVMTLIGEIVYQEAKKGLKYDDFNK